MMKNYRLLWGASALILAGAIAVPFAFDQTQMYVPRNEKASDRKAQGAKGAAEWLLNMRKNPVTGRVDYADVIKAQEQVKYFDKLAANSRPAGPSLIWQELGPDNVGGRTRAFLIDKDNRNLLFTGGVGGGLWKSTDGAASWHKYRDTLANLAVSALCQAANGDIYFGTGEGMYYLLGSGSGGFIGGGVWKSTDRGNTFTRLASTIPGNINSPSTEWAAVNRLAAHPSNSNLIFAATDRGIRISKDGGVTWSNPVTTSPGGTTAVIGQASDVDVASDGSVIAAINGRGYFSPSGDLGTWYTVSTGGTNELPASGLSRIEFAISPDDPNYIYASAATATGRLNNIYLSVNKGETWSIIGPGGTLAFEPFSANSQGDYDNAIAVVPGNKHKIVLGGVELWSWQANSPGLNPATGQWTRIAVEQPDAPQNPYYVHADKHYITFQDGVTFYVATDGGIFKTIDGGRTFINSNKNYNVTQFYTVAFKHNAMSPSGAVGSAVMGGTQDNGTRYINTRLNTEMTSEEVFGGDGGYCEFSELNPQAMFATIYYGDAFRSATDGNSMSGFYNARMSAITGDPGDASFVTPIALWESPKDTESPDSVWYVVPSSVGAGASLNIPSLINPNTIRYTTPVALSAGDSIKVQDYFQSKFVVGMNSAVFLTRQALDFTTEPSWIKIAGTKSVPSPLTGIIQTMTWANSGDMLYVGTEAGRLFRLTNIRAALDSATSDVDINKTTVVCTQIAAFSGRCVTGIAVDPEDAGRVVVTLGNYGSSQYVWYSDNADLAPASSGTGNFVNKTGTTLPSMPVYSATFDAWDRNTVILGTEFGIYGTDNITATSVTWDHINPAQNAPNTPVFMVRQQQLPTWRSNNSRTFYAATHGRGIWKSSNLQPTVGVEEKAIQQNINASVVVTPNPVSEKALVAFTLAKSADVTLKIFDLRGKLVKTVTRKSQAGVVQIEIGSEELNAGTYIVSIEAGAQTGTTKFVVVK